MVSLTYAYFIIKLSAFIGDSMLVKITIALGAVAVALLTACGGGGGGGGDPLATGLQNPSAFRLSETVSAVPPQ